MRDGDNLTGEAAPTLGTDNPDTKALIPIASHNTGITTRRRNPRTYG
jgi:hypothetical protein